MRELILKMSISVDGFVSAADRGLDWIIDTPDDAMEAWTMESLHEAGVHVMGAHTYADMAAYWPTSTLAYAESMNRLPKVVFSKRGRLEPPQTDPVKAKSGGWIDPTIARDARVDMQRLKEQKGKPILAHGGAMLAQELVASGLIDEYRLLIHPVAIGAGFALFSRLPEPLHLKAVRTIPFENGAVARVYRPA